MGCKSKIPVLISIRTEYCDLITSGAKTLEIRKSRPMRSDLEYSFDTYIYKCGTYSVVGKFECDRIYKYTTCPNIEGSDISEEDVIRLSCLSKSQLEEYEMANKEGTCRVGLYCWHISNLVVYDEPKRLVDMFHIERPPQSWRYIYTHIYE